MSTLLVGKNSRNFLQREGGERVFQLQFHTRSWVRVGARRLADMNNIIGILLKYNLKPQRRGKRWGWVVVADKRL